MQKVRHLKVRWGDNVKRGSQLQARKFPRKTFNSIKLLLKTRDYCGGELIVHARSGKYDVDYTTRNELLVYISLVPHNI